MLEISRALDRHAVGEAEKKFVDAMDALSFESIELSLYFEEKLAGEMSKRSSIPPDLMNAFIEYFAWQPRFVNLEPDNRLQYAINSLFYNNHRRQSDAAHRPHVTEDKKSVFRYWWIMLVLFHIISSAARNCNTNSGIGNKANLLIMREQLEKMKLAEQQQLIEQQKLTDLEKFKSEDDFIGKARQRARYFRIAEDPKIYNSFDPNCRRLWLSEDGMTCSFIACSEWERRRRAEIERENIIIEIPKEYPIDSDDNRH